MYCVAPWMTKTYNILINRVINAEQSSPCRITYIAHIIPNSTHIIPLCGFFYALMGTGRYTLGLHCVRIV
jgi:hypothetical protein